MDQKCFELYRKWFNTLLVKDFLNLPYKDQSKFMAMVDKFSKDCAKVHEEAKVIHEKTIKINVQKILQKDDTYTIIGSIGDIQIPIKYFKADDLPAIGSSFCCIIYSSDEENWFSSKEELITGGSNAQTNLVLK
jgi:hypothetical protein